MIIQKKSFGEHLLSISDPEIEYKFTAGELIKALRIYHGMNQMEFAKEVDIAQGTLSKIEANKLTTLPFDLINRVCLITKTDLRCFQKGFLSHNLSEVEQRVLTPFFDSKGISARECFMKLEKICIQRNKSIYRDLGMEKVLFAFESIRYSESLVL